LICRFGETRQSTRRASRGHARRLRSTSTISWICAGARKFHSRVPWHFFQLRLKLLHDRELDCTTCRRFACHAVRNAQRNPSPCTMLENSFARPQFSASGAARLLRAQ
jgi:hypothetical protein